VSGQYSSIRRRSRPAIDWRGASFTIFSCVVAGVTLMSSADQDGDDVGADGSGAATSDGLPSDAASPV
jgi:hypothetical protein